MQHFGSQNIEVVLLAVVTLALLFQTIILIALFIAMRKAARAATEQIAGLRSSVTPLIENTHAFVTRVGPKIEKTTEDLSAITQSLRAQISDLQIASNDISARVRIQAGRLDAQVTDLLDSLDRAGNYLNDAVAKPMRQLSAIFASARAVIESLRNAERGPRSDSAETADDRDMFV